MAFKKLVFSLGKSKSLIFTNRIIWKNLDRFEKVKKKGKKTRCIKEKIVIPNNYDESDDSRVCLKIVWNHTKRKKDVSRSPQKILACLSFTVVFRPQVNVSIGDFNEPCHWNYVSV